MSDFKVGDRVVYKEGTCWQDFGVVTHFGFGIVYADWESDGFNAPVDINYVKHAEPKEERRMEREFKVGDRVVFNKGMSYEDFGVVTHFYEDLVYADWESNGRNLNVRLSKLKHAEPKEVQKNGT